MRRDWLLSEGDRGFGKSRSVTVGLTKTKEGTPCRVRCHQAQGTSEILRGRRRGVKAFEGVVLIFYDGVGVHAEWTF